MIESKKQVNYVKNGVINFFGERIALFPPNLIPLFSSIYGDGAKSLLVFLGKKMGRRMIEIWDESLKPNTLEQLTTIFSSYMSTSGWGKFDPVLITEHEIILNVKHNVCEELDIHTKHICYFLKGLLLGFGEYALYRADVNELECTNENENGMCVFSIKKKMWHLIPAQSLIKSDTPGDLKI